MADEVKRRLVHASGAVVPGLYLAGLVTWEQFQWIMIAGTLVAGALEVVRLWIGLDWAIFERLTREYEQEQIAGYALYVFGGTIAAVLFAPEFVIPALLMLTLADPVSGLTSSGELRTVKHPVVLTIMFLTCFALALFTHVVVFADLTLEAMVAAAAAATVADGVKPRFGDFVLDDNLSIPIAAAVGGWAAFQYLPDVAVPIAAFVAG